VGLGCIKKKESVDIVKTNKVKGENKQNGVLCEMQIKKGNEKL
jgi:hypothetical protein